MKFRFFPIFSVILLLSACHKLGTFEGLKGIEFQHTRFFKSHVNKLTLNISWKQTTRKIYIFFPSHFVKKGQVLLLHGWNLPPLQWFEETSLDEKLLDAGFILIVPDMGKSLYAKVTYKETLPVFKHQPLLSWLKDTVIPYLQDTINLFKKGDNNFIIGLSTGARGAFALLLEEPFLFSGVGLLSGDYDQTLNPNDNLMIYHYGNYEHFPNRWEGKDNLLREFIRKMSYYKDCFLPPLYVAHGMDDPVVSVVQSDTLVRILLHYGCNIQYRFVKGEKHNYHFWENETPYLTNFILTQVSKNTASASIK
ncbi:MAG: alpha/beta hydrolase-fold protein [Bacteroidales bacterium]|nr:alpha/beta hydrolase-fold protein [Bacteroidales bacterium]